MSIVFVTDSPLLSIKVRISGIWPIAKPFAMANFGGVEISSLFDEVKLV
jgi:hypothetical protein